MPYSSATDPKLPDKVKKMTEKERRAFVAAFNSSFERCRKEGGSVTDCEGKAFPVAYTAVTGVNEAATAVSEKVGGAVGGGFGAKGGQRIKGRLFRSRRGRFSSGPNDEQLATLGIDRSLSDALINAIGSKELTPEQLATLEKEGMIVNGELSRDARALALALRSRNVKSANSILKRIEKGKKGKGGGGGKAKPSKEQKQKENRDKVISGLTSADLKAETLTALFSFYDGEELKKDQADRLFALGLIDRTDAGESVLSTLGRRLANAANRGDLRAAADALKKAAERRREEQRKREEKEKKEKDEQTKEAEPMNKKGKNTAVFTFEAAAELFPEGIPNEITADHVPAVNRAIVMLPQLNGDRVIAEENLREFRQALGLPENLTAIEVFDTIAAMNETGEVEGDDAFDLVRSTLTAETAVDENGYMPVEYMPMNAATSFADLEAMQASRKAAAAISRYASQFPMLVSNIMSSESENKAAAVRELAAEFADLVAAKLDMLNQEDGDMSEGDPDHFRADVSATTIGLVETASESGPLMLDIQVIEPGWGNKRDNHYYPADMLRRDARVFRGVKMYETDHRPDETNNRTWVSTIIEAGKRFTPNGAPIARVGVHDPVFAEKVRNLNKLGLLDRLQCSIRADGTIGGEYKENGRVGRVVASITEAKTVDWVTNAGAGGRALNLVESEEIMEDKNKEVEEQEVKEQEVELTESDTATAEETETEETETEETPEPLTETEVSTVLDGFKLPDASRERLAKGQYLTEAAVRDAAEGEIAYIMKLTGSGEPLQMGEVDNGSGTAEQLTAEESDARFNEIFKDHGLPV